MGRTKIALQHRRNKHEIDLLNQLSALSKGVLVFNATQKSRVLAVAKQYSFNLVAQAAQRFMVDVDTPDDEHWAAKNFSETVEQLAYVAQQKSVGDKTALSNAELAQDFCDTFGLDTDDANLLAEFISCSCDHHAHGKLGEISLSERGARGLVRNIRKYGLPAMKRVVTCYEETGDWPSAIEVLASQQTLPPTLQKNAELPSAPVESRESGKLQTAAMGFLDDGVLAETVRSEDGKFVFLTSAGRIQMTHEQKGQILAPPAGLEPFVRKGIMGQPQAGLFLPSAAEHGHSTNEVLSDIQKFLSEWVDAPQSWLQIASYYVLMTWVYDKFTVVPYLRFLGESGTGKTRLLEALSAISFRALLTNGNTSVAGLFRTIDILQGTVAIDESDFKNSSEQADIAKVFNNGYKANAPVIRAEGTSEGYAPTPFVVYGPKIIGTRKRFEDDAIESRCLTFETKRLELSQIHARSQLNDDFYRQANTLQNRLLGWRFDSFADVRVEEEPVRALKISPRLAEVAITMYSAVRDEEARRNILGFLERYYAHIQGDSTATFVMEALAQLEEEIRSPKGCLMSGITATVNAGRDPADSIHSRKIASIVRSLGKYRLERSRYGQVVLPADGKAEF